MAEKIAYGLTSLKMGAIAGDGGMGTILTSVGSVYQDSCEVIQEDAEITEHYSEQSDDPIETIETLGKKTVKFSLVDMTPDTMVLFLGGTVTEVDLVDQWNAPATPPVLEKSFELITRNGNKIKIPRGKIASKINWKVSKKEVAKIDVTVTVLQPTKAGEAAWQVQ